MVPKYAADVFSCHGAVCDRVYVVVDCDLQPNNKVTSPSATGKVLHKLVQNAAMSGLLKTVQWEER